jgi:hypothetical protein
MGQFQGFKMVTLHHIESFKWPHFVIFKGDFIMFRHIYSTGTLIVNFYFSGLGRLIFGKLADLQMVQQGTVQSPNL